MSTNVFDLKSVMEKKFHRWLAGHHITCPHCGGILDYRRMLAVSCEEKGTQVFCVSCWQNLLERIASKLGRTELPEPEAVEILTERGFEIIDGRQWRSDR